MIGDSPAGMITLENRPFHCTPWLPAAASVEPITPPISACDELDGMPSSQVSRFQMMPPAKPANTTVNVTTCVSTRPLAIVAATLNDKNAPTRFSTPDSATASRGFSAPVAMEVAIALPVSWNPFVKSKANAVTTTNTSNRLFPTLAVSNVDEPVVDLATNSPSTVHLLVTLRCPPATSARGVHWAFGRGWGDRAASRSSLRPRCWA